MVKYTSVQYAFTAGVLDNSTVSRPDLDAYFSGALVLNNVLPLPLGGVKTRPGMEFVADVSGIATVATSKLISFVNEHGVKFVVVLTSATATIIDANDGSVMATLFPPSGGFDVDNTNWVQTLDTLILTRATGLPTRIAQKSSGWVWEDLPIKKDQYPMMVKGSGGGAKIKSSDITGSVTLSTTTRVFSGYAVGDYFRGNGGFGKITAIGDGNTSAVVDLIDGFDSTSEFKVWSIETPSWSTKKGYPNAVCLLQGRLFFGGSTAQPDTLWGSKSGDYFNFSATARNLPDDGVSTSLDAERAVQIKHIYGTKQLFVFTTAGLFVCSAVGSKGGITPSSFVFPRYTNDIVSNVRVAELDGAVVFTKVAENNQSAIFEVGYQGDADMASVSLTTLAGRKIKNPTCLAVANNFDNTQLLYAVLADGTMGVFHSNRGQNISAWTTLSTTGAILQVASGGGSVWILAKRNIGKQDKYFIEKISQNHHMDSAKKLTNNPASATISVNHLSGEQVRVITDSVDMGLHTVQANGQVKLSSPIINCEVGFDFDWLVKTMPIVVVSSQGKQYTHKLRLRTVSAQIEDAVVLSVNNEVKIFTEFDTHRFDTTAVRFTGRAETFHSTTLNDTVEVKVFGTGIDGLSLFALTAEVSKGS